MSPTGGQTPLAATGARDSVIARLPYDAAFMNKLGDAKTPDEVDPFDYAAIYYAGGHGAMWDLPDATQIHRMTTTIFESKGVVGGVCHGPAGLVNVKLSDGSYLVAGRTVSAFTNAEEEAADATDIMPFLLETRLRGRGPEFTQGPKWEAHVAESGRLTTGQNPASAEGGRGDGGGACPLYAIAVLGEECEYRRRVRVCWIRPEPDLRAGARCGVR